MLNLSSISLQMYPSWVETAREWTQAVHQTLVLLNWVECNFSSKSLFLMIKDNSNCSYLAKNKSWAYLKQRCTEQSEAHSPNNVSFQNPILLVEYFLWSCPLLSQSLLYHLKIKQRGDNERTNSLLLTYSTCGRKLTSLIEINS
jgi:hypothetical protein